MSCQTPRTASAACALGLALSLFGLTSTASAFELASQVDRVITEAKKVQLEAEEIRSLLKPKQVDWDKVRSMTDSLSEGVNKVDAAVHELESGAQSLSPAQRDNLELVKMKAQLLRVFTQLKSDQVAAADAAKNRGMLRAQADGIAKRAELLQRTALRIRSL